MHTYLVSNASCSASCTYLMLVVHTPSIGVDLKSQRTKTTTTDCNTTEKPRDMMEDSDDDEADFMAKVNVYLSGSQEDETILPSLPSQSLEGILRKSSSTKTVQFAVDDFGLSNPEIDASKSKQELLSEIARLTEVLREAENQVSLEQSKRKKKESNLMKLAKELKKRIAQQAMDKEKIEELEEKKQYLEHHWVLAGKELDQEKELRKKVQTEQYEDFERILRDEKEKNSTLRKNYDQQIDDLKLAHSKQCDELGKQILKATLEADRLHNQLVGAPRKTKIFETKSSNTILTRFLVSLMLLLLFALFGQTINLFTRDAICSPVMPGRSLTRANAPSFFQAPWWAPDSHKVWMHAKYCTQAPPVSLQWLSDGQDQRLIVNHGQKVTLKKAGLVKAEVLGDRIRTWTKKGKTEDHLFLWHA